MNLRRRILTILPFLALLYVYAHSEGQQFPKFLLIFFTSLFFLELCFFLLFRFFFRLEWHTTDIQLPVDSSITINLSLKALAFSLGMIQGHLKLPKTIALEEPLVFFFKTTPFNSSWQKTFKIKAVRRGRYLIGPLVFTLEDPLSLFRQTISFGPQQEIWITPRLLPFENLFNDSHTSALSKLPSFIGQPASSAREYKYGDSLQRVHWKATAHLQKLMVREEEAFSDKPAFLWLDLSRHTYWKDPEALEKAVSLAATLITYFEERHQPITFWATGTDYAKFSTPGNDFREILRYLSLAQATTSEPPEQAVLALPSNVELIGITRDLTPELAAQLTPRVQKGEQVIIFATKEHCAAQVQINNGIEVRSC